MKKSVTREATFCDHCGKEQSWADECMNCGKVCCHDCEKKGLMVEFRHSLTFSGSGDGHFCPGCAINPKPALRPLVAAYQRLDLLGKQSESFWKQLREEQAGAEAEVKNLYQKAGFK